MRLLLVVVVSRASVVAAGIVIGAGYNGLSLPVVTIRFFVAPAEGFVVPLWRLLYCK